MNKFYFDGIIVVEGKADVAFLSSFIDSEFVITNGYDIPQLTIDYLSSQKNRKILILTDPDEAGINIRAKLNALISNAANVEVNIKLCNKNNKHGVAECQENEIINKLKPYFIDIKNLEGALKQNDLFELGLIGPGSTGKRIFLTKELNLGFCSAKTLLKRINFNKIKLETIKECLKRYED